MSRANPDRPRGVYGVTHLYWSAHGTVWTQDWDDDIVVGFGRPLGARVMFTGLPEELRDVFARAVRNIDGLLEDRVELADRYRFEREEPA